ncbi:hypothetical protein V9T40_013270 [Parthenolecanium corni]|uniref:Uncharacterized protein n=1 Tax=Parthenolecanium corni TaxID=536013 RepID=A0AAN9TNF4_9HEMI
MVTEGNVHPVLEVLLCKGCINRHFRLARTIFKEIEERKWKCCVCFPKPIWSQRAVCAAAKNYADSSNDALKERIAKCNAVRKPASLPVSAHNQSASFGVVHVTQSQTVNSVSMNTGQQQRPSVPSSALVSQARNLDLEWIGIDDSARAVSNEVKSIGVPSHSVTDARAHAQLYKSVFHPFWMHSIATLTDYFAEINRFDNVTIIRSIKPSADLHNSVVLLEHL